MDYVRPPVPRGHVPQALGGVWIRKTPRVSLPQFSRQIHSPKNPQQQGFEHKARLVIY